MRQAALQTSTGIGRLELCWSGTYACSTVSSPSRQSYAVAGNVFDHSIFLRQPTGASRLRKKMGRPAVCWFDTRATLTSPQILPRFSSLVKLDLYVKCAAAVSVCLSQITLSQRYN